MTRGDYFKGKRVLITGASSGIGAALARDLGQAGAVLLLHGRDVTRLQTVAEFAITTPRVILGDLCDPDTVTQISNVINETGLDIAILNAGTSNYNSGDHFDAAHFWSLMEKNVKTMVDCAERCIPTLLHSHGQLVLMSSLAAYGGLPQSAGYGASKAAIRILAQSLDIDLRSKGVAVSCVCPGFVKTPLTDQNRFSMPFLMLVDSASRTILDGIQHKKHEIHFPKRFSLLLKVIMSLPASWQHFLVSLTANYAN